MNCVVGWCVGSLQPQLRELLVCIQANSADKELLIFAKSLNLLMNKDNAILMKFCRIYKQMVDTKHPRYQNFRVNNIKKKSYTNAKVKTIELGYTFQKLKNH